MQFTVADILFAIEAAAVNKINIKCLAHII